MADTPQPSEGSPSATESSNSRVAARIAERRGVGKYHTTADTCGCPDYKYRQGPHRRVCKHIKAFRVLYGGESDDVVSDVGSGVEGRGGSGGWLFPQEDMDGGSGTDGTTGEDHKQTVEDEQRAGKQEGNEIPF